MAGDSTEGTRWRCGLVCEHLFERVPGKTPFVLLCLSVVVVERGHEELTGIEEIFFSLGVALLCVVLLVLWQNIWAEDQELVDCHDEVVRLELCEDLLHARRRHLR